jgi:hypothetical protein
MELIPSPDDTVNYFCGFTMITIRLLHSAVACPVSNLVTLGIFSSIGDESAYSRVSLSMCRYSLSTLFFRYFVPTQVLCYIPFNNKSSSFILSAPVLSLMYLYRLRLAIAL